MANKTNSTPGATGSTGNVTGNAIPLPPEYDNVSMQFVVEAVGATPTITYKAQVSLDNLNWYDAPYITPATSTVATAALTRTAVGADAIFLDQPVVRDWAWIRYVTSANTNVTFRVELYLSKVLSR